MRVSQGFSDVPLSGIGVGQKLWASLGRSPQLPSKKASRLFLFVLFFLLVGFLFLRFVFILFPAFISHGIPPSCLRWTFFWSMVVGSVEKSRQQRSRQFPVLTYEVYAPRLKLAVALLDGLF
jgi:hypothetical protein